MKNCWLIIFISVVLISCARNLKEDITLNIDESQVDYGFYYPESGNYFDAGDSSYIYNQVTRDLGDAFREKGNDVTLISSTGDYTLRLINFSFGESMTGESVTDPCDSSSTLSYDVSVIRGSMYCEVINNFTGQSEFVGADAESDEDVKDHPTFFQRLVGNDSCYTPKVSNAHPDAVKRRLVRRLHRHAMQVIKQWQ